MSVINMNCLEGLALFPDAYFDSVVTDPPYELGFMGNGWDASGIAYSVPLWREVLRVLKPGGHMLAFSGSRTYHRMTCAIEDAGFEIRDQIMWVYGSGFPKSLDVSKALDKAAGAEREIISERPASDPVGGGTFNGHAEGATANVTRAATHEAQQWQGWGTALKPAHEPVCVARKPLIGTVAANVLQHGTGALNIDGCRVGSEVITTQAKGHSADSQSGLGKTGFSGCPESEHTGRWPANLIHDGSAEVLAVFPNAKGQAGALSGDEPSNKTAGIYGDYAVRGASSPRGDMGSAARFFYCAKASTADRDEGLETFGAATVSDGRAVVADNAYQRGATERRNIHPTVKPTDLMRYLCRLVTPPGGLVLDPFTGSGSTGKGAVLEGFQFVGFELSPEYTAIAQARIDHARKS